ncbi:hypothetical protein [Pseudomonas sp. fls2-241-TYG-175]|uniref:hypothetical protein n=1 Tax=Pseudomonas sp. fls2-241-TYG-175 TaxID=3040312 RepID=UPI002554DEC5|nr:hypothetical protein [Pseudomonas sp. fls2-241-TYG-175]
MRNSNRQDGMMIWGFSCTILLCVLGGYALGLLAPLVPIDKPVMPITIMAIFLAPITLSTTLIFKLIDIKKLKGLNRDEKRRIGSIIKAKTLRILLLIFIYFISAASIGILFFASSIPDGAITALFTLRVAGAFLGFAISTSIIVLMETIETNNFEVKITNRSTERKAKAALLKRLESKS